MNEDPTDLEIELRRLQPILPSERFRQQIDSLLDNPDPARLQPPSAWWRRLGFSRPAAAFGWGLLSPCAAAGLVALITVHLSAGEPLPSPSAASGAGGNLLAPVQASPANLRAVPASGQQREVNAVNVLYETLDEGVVMDGARNPVRRLRCRSADRVRWDNPQTGAKWEVSYPREDVLLIPIEAE